MLEEYMVRAPHSRLSYELDRDDRIRTVDEAWDTFAFQNGAPELAEGHVLGRLLWDFVQGPETIRLLKLVFGRVREGARAVQIPFRCDSPELRRYMTFDASPGDKGNVLIRTELVRDEPRVRPATVLDPHAARGEAFLRMCSWCNRFQTPDGAWDDVEDVIRRLDLFSEPELPWITHGICRRCGDLLREEIPE